MQASDSPHGTPRGRWHCGGYDADETQGPVGGRRERLKGRRRPSEIEIRAGYFRHRGRQRVIPSLNTACDGRSGVM